MADSLAELKKDPYFWQRLLTFAGFSLGRIDGIIGVKTRAAETRWAEEASSILAEQGAFDERSERNISTLIPETQEAARKWLRLAKAEAAKRGLDIRIIGGTRTYAEQEALFNQRPKVTNARAGQSFHNFGLAWDFGVFEGKKYFDEHPLYDAVGELAAQIPGAEWGGTWRSFRDRPHIQLSKYSTSAQAKAHFEK